MRLTSRLRSSQIAIAQSGAVHDHAHALATFVVDQIGTDRWGAGEKADPSNRQRPDVGVYRTATGPIQTWGFMLWTQATTAVPSPA